MLKTEDVKVHACVFAFDLLFYNGEPTVKEGLARTTRALARSLRAGRGASFGFRAVWRHLREIEENSDTAG